MEMIPGSPPTPILNACTRSDRDHRRDGRTDHTANQWESIFQVDTKECRLRYTKITGDTCWDIDLLCSFVFLLKNGHCQNAGALRNVRKRDHRPENRSVIRVDQLGVNGIRHVMKPCHNNRRIEQSEQPSKQPSEAGHQSTIDNIRNGVSYGPTDRSYHGMCE